MNVDQGSNPMLAKGPSITDGKNQERKLRRLGIKQLFALSKMIKRAVIWGSMDFQARFKRAMSPDNSEDILYLVLMGLTEVEDDFIKFFAETMGVTEKEITDPEVFPLGSEVQFIEALVKHPDIQAFFARMTSGDAAPLVEKVKAQMKTMSEDGSEPSTDSGAAMASATPT